MGQLLCKCGDRIIRFGLHGGITEQSEVEARNHSFSDIHSLEEPVSRNPFQ